MRLWKVRGNSRQAVDKQRKKPAHGAGL